MFVRWYILVFLLTNAGSKCVKNKIKLWSPTKCEAGRRFFVRLSNLEAFVNASIPQPYLFPWLSEIIIARSKEVEFCSGALINDRYVLTAQSCFLPPLHPHQVTVRVGFYNGYDKDVSEIFQPRRLERRAAQILLHPGYNPNDPRTSAYNLALVKLEQPVKYSKTIFPVQLPAPGDESRDYGNQLGENVEWSFFRSQDSKILKHLPVKILNAGQCSSYSDIYKRIITSKVLCSVKREDARGPCGDERGGLLLQEKLQRTYNVSVLVGVSAWQPPPCQLPESPRVYTRIAEKVHWIKDNTRDGLYCRY